MTTKLEPVVEAAHAADLLCQSLQAANKHADAVGAMLLLPMLVEAVKLRDQLNWLQAALAESIPQQPRAALVAMKTASGNLASVPACDVPDFLRRGGSFWSPEDHVRYVEAVERGEVPGVGLISVDSKVKP